MKCLKLKQTVELETFKAELRRVSIFVTHTPTIGIIIYLLSQRSRALMHVWLDDRSHLIHHLPNYLLMQHSIILAVVNNPCLVPFK